MPNTVRVTRRVKFLEISVYILLICFFIPIRINHHDIEEQFKDYLKQFNKTYNDHSIYKKKLAAFKSSLKEIERLNSNRTKPSSASYGLTKYSDMLPEEFEKNHLRNNFSHYLQKNAGFVPSSASRSNNIVKRTAVTVPSKIDWRKKNVVTPVANQQSCGACWAFAAVEIAESRYAIKTGKLEQLSVQKMIDCAKNNDGCDGGDVYAVLDWIKEENVTLVKEQEYPLTLDSQQCRNVSSAGVWIKDFDCGSFTGTEELIIQLLAKQGPIAVAINAMSWQNYVKGIIQFHCDSSILKLNHAVQIVGYDLSADIPHYIVRNSWGTDFGDDGYLYIAIGDNLCGLAREVCVVEVL